MRRSDRIGMFDYYEAALPVGKDQVRYEFEVTRGSEVMPGTINWVRTASRVNSTAL